MKFWRIAVLAVLATALASSSAVAATAAPSTVTREHFPVHFFIPFGPPCAELPPGVTVEGFGELFDVTETRVGQDGVTHQNIHDTAFGVALDNHFKIYFFDYDNHFSIDIPPGGGFPRPIRMTDRFDLNGRGSAKMHVTFVIAGTIDSADDVFPWHTRIISMHGDAFNCDPI
jgi:hypothetical protein